MPSASKPEPEDVAAVHDAGEQLGPRRPSQAGGQQLIPDAFRRLREADGGRFDAVIVEMPDPDATATAKRYSIEFYALARRVFTPGRTAVQATYRTSRRALYSCVLATVRSAGLGAAPYHVDVPSLGDWGFALAGVSWLV